MRDDETLEIPVSKSMYALYVFKSCFLVPTFDCTRGQRHWQQWISHPLQLMPWCSEIQYAFIYLQRPVKAHGTPWAKPYRSLPRLHLSSADGDKGIETDLHTPLVSEVLHQLWHRRVSPRRPMYLLADSRIWLLCHAFCICVARVPSQSCPSFLLVLGFQACYRYRLH